MSKDTNNRDGEGQNTGEFFSQLSMGAYNLPSQLPVLAVGTILSVSASQLLPPTVTVELTDEQVISSLKKEISRSYSELLKSGKIIRDTNFPYSNISDRNALLFDKIKHGIFDMELSKEDCSFANDYLQELEKNVASGKFHINSSDLKRSTNEDFISNVDEYLMECKAVHALDESSPVDAESILKQYMMLTDEQQHVVLSQALILIILGLHSFSSD